MFYQFNHLGSPDYIKIERNKNFCFAPHLHRCYEIIVILSGEMKILIDNKEYILKENEALMIFPNQIHSLHSENSEHVLSIFSPNLVKAFYAKTNRMLPKDNKFLPDKYLIDSLKSLSNDCSIFEKKGLLYSLCGQFDKNAYYISKHKVQDNLLFKIFSFVEENFNSECSLEKISKEIGYNYSYVSRFFKKSVGISFNKYVMHYRLSHACYLLYNTESTVLTCALESGFDSIRTFNRVFKETYGISPSKYQKLKL